jgi:hypothetical protein
VIVRVYSEEEFAMPDFDGVTISSGATQVVSIEPGVNKFKKLTGGSIVCCDDNGKPCATLSAFYSEGQLSFSHAQTNQQRVWLKGGDATHGGRLSLMPHTSPTATVVLDADAGQLAIKDSAGVQVASLGPNGLLDENGAILRLYGSEGKLRLDLRADDKQIRILDDTGIARVVVNGHSPAMVLITANDEKVMELSQFNELASILAGGFGHTGRIELYPKTGEMQGDSTISLYADNARIKAGGKGVGGQFVACDKNGDATVTMDGAVGNILLANSDCAEDFDVAALADAEPGTVMVLDDEGSLVESSCDYDRRVAGVISGSGDYKAGIVLGKCDTGKRRAPLALLGKTFCKADANLGPIEVGDLLTTSPTRGHAMKAADPSRAFGAIIGKALRSLESGRGVIPILIALQ